MLEKFFNGVIWKSEKKDDDDDGKGRKIPSGFEKLLRRTKRSITHDKNEDDSASKKDEKEASKKSEDKDAD